MKRFSRLLAALAFVLSPSAVLADGLLPAINAYSNTSVFYFMFAVVVLIETACIRLWLRRVPLLAVLWRVVLLNAVSSFAGYLLMRSNLRPEFSDVWQQAIPFFFLTLCVELPLLLILFVRAPASWGRKLLAGTIANVLSYVFLVAAERPVEDVWLARLSAADGRTLAQWTNTQMLAQTTGLIYGTESSPGSPHHRLRVFEPRANRWHSLTNCPPIDPRNWEVEGDLVAFKHLLEKNYAPNDITVRKLPGFAPVAEISVPTATNSESGWALKISPDRTKLAVLVPLHGLPARLGEASHGRLGITCDLVVYDITSGKVLCRSPRKALRGLCWLPNSRHVLFTSLRSQELLELTALEKGWERKYPDADRRFSDAPTYAYDIQTGSVDYFGAMESPQLAAQGGRLVYRAEPDGAFILDPATGQTNKVQIGWLGHRDPIVSPDGRFAVVYLTLANPLSYLGYPAIVDLSAPTRRHFLGGFDYQLKWTVDVGHSTTTTQANALPRAADLQPPPADPKISPVPCL